ncbi:DNA-3-methyladenine glycosylase [Bryobacterales bacterium F-183]|nr:DNA-3-methyladenine glycosylase [Bryobacterales bacterium F-183]
MRKAILHLKKTDPVIAEIIARVGPYRKATSEVSFHSLARSIVYQQLSGKAAATIFGRVMTAAKCQDCLTPEKLLKVKPEQLRAAGLSQQKLSYVRDLAEKTKGKLVDFEALHTLEDQAVIEHLTQVKGVGVWTVQMLLMFALDRPDVLPTADLGIRNAMKKAYGLAEAPKPKEMEAIAEKWRPYRTVACWYLWRSLDGPAAL